MRRRTVTLPASDHGDLLKPPHVLSQFMDAIIGKQLLSSDQQEQRRKHLAECLHCQAFLGSYLVSTLTEQDNPDERARELLTQLRRIMHETFAANISAYVDRLVENGKEEADNQFPLFAEHLQTCQGCRRAVQELQAWLKQLW